MVLEHAHMGFILKNHVNHVGNMRYIATGLFSGGRGCSTWDVASATAPTRAGSHP